ncbi:unnamed protein product, partial [Amoebophrya sp. A25]|eukprot:GSA25T00023076001.1
MSKQHRNPQSTNDAKLLVDCPRGHTDVMKEHQETRTDFPSTSPTFLSEDVFTGEDQGSLA